MYIQGYLRQGAVIGKWEHVTGTEIAAVDARSSTKDLMHVDIVHLMLDREAELCTAHGPSISDQVHDDARRWRTGQRVRDWSRGYIPVLVHEVVTPVDGKPLLDPTMGLHPELT